MGENINICHLVKELFGLDNYSRSYRSWKYKSCTRSLGDSKLLTQLSRNFCRVLFSFLEPHRVAYQIKGLKITKRSTYKEFGTEVLCVPD